MKWLKIALQDAQEFYGIPATMANDGHNVFFGAQIDLPHGYDMPRPLIAFLMSKENPSVVTFHVQTIEPETWEFQGRLPNPLTMEGGILGLDRSGLNGLIEIFSSYHEQLPYITRKKEQMFITIKSSELDKFRLHPNWFPNTRLENYIQAYDPAITAEESSTTILILSHSSGFAKINMELRQFSSLELKNPNFEPLYRGLSKINLDKNGVQEFIEILEGQLRYI